MTGISLRAPVNSRARQMAEQLLARSQSTAPIRSPLQAIAQMLQAGVQSKKLGQFDEQDQERRQQMAQLLQAAQSPGIPQLGAGPASAGPESQQVPGQNQALAMMLADQEMAPMAMQLMGQQTAATQRGEDVAFRNRQQTALETDRAEDNQFQRDQQEATEEYRAEQVRLAEEASRATTESARADAASEVAANRVSREDDLRSETTAKPEVKSAIEVASQYRRFSTLISRDDGAGDLGSVFTFMKMFDPESVVRESEFATAAAARAWLQRMEEDGVRLPGFVAIGIQNIENGGFLGEDQRQQMQAAARDLVGAARTTYGQATAQVVGIAQQDGLDLSRIVADPFSDLFGPSDQINDALGGMTAGDLGQGADGVIDLTREDVR
jgi:hypothetical protein